MFNDLWSQRSFLQSWRQSSEINVFFCINITIGSLYRRVYLKLWVQMVYVWITENVRKRVIFDHFFRAFNDLWGQRSILQKCEQLYEICAEKVSKEYHSWFMNWMTLKLRVQISKKNSEGQIFKRNFRTFIDLWGQRSILLSWRQSYEICVEKNSKEYDRWFMIYKIPSYQFNWHV